MSVDACRTRVYEGGKTASGQINDGSGVSICSKQWPSWPAPLTGQPRGDGGAPMCLPGAVRGRNQVECRRAHSAAHISRILSGGDDFAYPFRVVRQRPDRIASSVGSDRTSPLVRGRGKDGGDQLRSVKNAIARLTIADGDADVVESDGHALNSIEPGLRLAPVASRGMIEYASEPGPRAGSRVLEPGCGPGHYAERLARTRPVIISPLRWGRK